MTTSENTHPKEGPPASVDAAKIRRGHTRRFEYADFLQKTDQVTQGTGNLPWERYPGPAYSFEKCYCSWWGWRRRWWYSERNLGPGSHNPKAPSKRDPGPSYSFGSRRDLEDTVRFWERNLGPGSHYPKAPSKREPGPSYSFGSKHRDKDDKASPGPCYAPPSPSMLRPGPKFSITSRHMPSRFAITVEEE